MPRPAPKVTSPNPHHESALTKDDLTPDRHIVVCDIKTRKLEAYCVVKPPCFCAGKYKRGLVVEMRSIRTGSTCTFFLSDIGVVPGRKWDDSHYVVAIEDVTRLRFRSKDMQKVLQQSSEYMSV